MITAWLAVASAQSTCVVTADGAPVTSLDCVSGVGWRLRCTVPNAGPKVKVRASIPALGLAAEAVVPYLNESAFDLPLSGAFVATAPFGGLAAGMPIGPTQWCPANPPGPAGSRPSTELTLEVVSHAHTGFAEELLAGGVVNRVPTYDRGTVIATTRIPLLQREATGTGAVGGTPDDKPLGARLQLRGRDDAWVSVSVKGVRRDVPVAPGAVRLLIVDVPVADLAALSPDDPTKYLRDDLAGWFGGDPSSMLGVVAWSKADLPAPVPLAWSGNTARTDRVDLRITKGATMVRVVLGWREQGMDAPARKVVDDAVAATP